MSTLGDVIKQRRLALGLTQAEVAELAGITVRTIGKLERSETTSVKSLTAAGIERALQWEPGSLDALRQGGEPTVLESPSRTMARDMLETMTPEQRQKLPETFNRAAEVASKSIPPIDLSKLIPKAALEALTHATMPAGVIESIRGAAEATASAMLPSLIELLDTRKRSELTYDILDYLEENGHDVDALISEREGAGGEGGSTSSEDASNKQNVRSLDARRDTPQSGADFDEDEILNRINSGEERFAAQEATEPLDEEWT